MENISNWTIEQCEDWFKSKNLPGPDMVEHFLHACGSNMLEDGKVPKWYDEEFLDLVRSQVQEDMIE